jgi:S1-C subfamily serine protease
MQSRLWISPSRTKWCIAGTVAIYFAASAAHAQLGGIGRGAGGIGGGAGRAVGGAAGQVGQGVQQGVGSATQGVQRSFDRGTGAVDRTLDRTGRALDRTQDRAMGTADRTLDRTGRVIDRTGDRTSRALDRTQGGGERILDRADETFDRTTDRAGRAVDRSLDRAGRAVDQTFDRTGRVLDRAGDVIDRTGERIRGRLGGRTGQWVWSDLGIQFRSRARGDLTIGSVASTSILAQAGLRRGDEIVSINGREFSSQAAALNYINRIGPSEELDVVVLRNGQYLNLDASLAGLDTQFAGRATARAYLGVTFDDRARDLRVFNIDRNSPAFRAGLRRGDTILSIDGQEFDSYTDAVDYIQGRSPNEQLDLVVWRDGREIDLQADLAGFGRGAGRAEGRTASWIDDSSRAGLGVVFDERSSDQVRVAQVTQGSPAEIAGLRRGDVILSVDGRRMSSFDDVTQYIGQRSPEEQVDIQVLRNGRRLNLEASLASRQEVFEDESAPARIDRDMRFQDDTRFESETRFDRTQPSTQFRDRFAEDEGIDASGRVESGRERESTLPGRVRESREAMRQRTSETKERFDGQRDRSGDSRQRNSMPKGTGRNGGDDRSSTGERTAERERNRGRDSTFGEGEPTTERESDPRRGSDDN